MNEETLTTEKKKEMLVISGLDWKVVPEGLVTTTGIIVPKRVALVREDTKKILGIHTDGYEIYQNDELLELLHRIYQKTGLALHTGGSFGGGEKVWFQLKSDDLKLGNDVIKGYISGFNSFDGKTSMAFGNSEITVSCQNTFWRGYKQVATHLRHSSTMRVRIEEILSRIDVLVKEEQDMFKEITRLSEVRMTAEVKELVTKMLFEIEVTEKLDAPTVPFSTNKKNKLIKFGYDLNLETAQKGDNLWGLFSGVTRYTTHSMKNSDNSESKMFGRAGKLEREIYSKLVEDAYFV
jgi:phage/plasmid-like protein (TIGR03299 family)